MKHLKVAVPEDTEAIRRRLYRALANHQCTDADAEFIKTRLDEIDARVSLIPDPNRREF